MRWFKMHVDSALDDPQLGMLSLESQAVYFKLYALAARYEQEGFIPGTAEQIAWMLRLSRATFEQNLKILAEAGMVEVRDDGVMVLRYEDEQARVTRAQAAERKRRQRQRERGGEAGEEEVVDAQEDSHAQVTQVSRSSHADVTPASQPSHAGVTPTSRLKTKNRLRTEKDLDIDPPPNGGGGVGEGEELVAFGGFAASGDGGGDIQDFEFDFSRLEKPPAGKAERKAWDAFLRTVGVPSRKLREPVLHALAEGRVTGLDVLAEFTRCFREAQEGHLKRPAVAAAVNLARGSHRGSEEDRDPVRWWRVLGEKLKPLVVQGLVPTQQQASRVRTWFEARRYELSRYSQFYQ